MRRTRRIAAVLLSLVLTGCGTSKVYRLPVEVESARRTFSPIVSVAQRMDLQVAEHPDSVGVRFDDSTWIYFWVQGDAYNMVVVNNDKNLPSAEVNARLAAAKTKGDEIWGKAIEAAKAANEAF